MIKSLIFALLASSIISLANAAEQELSCREELGRKQASILVRQCIDISPATHPPCNDQNSCALIKDEIKRGCEFARNTEGGKIPDYCE